MFQHKESIQMSNNESSVCLDQSVIKENKQKDKHKIQDIKLCSNKAYDVTKSKNLLSYR